MSESPTRPGRRATLRSVLLALVLVAGVSPAASADSDACVSIDDVTYCPSHAKTRLSVDGDELRFSGGGQAAPGVSLAFGAPASSVELALRPPASGPVDGPLLSLGGWTIDSAQVPRVEVEVTGDTTSIATSSTGPWQVELRRGGELVRAETQVSPTILGTGVLFDRVILDGEGAWAFHWYGEPFVLEDGTEVDSVLWSGAEGFGALNKVYVDTHGGGPLTHEDWLLGTWQYIACNPVDWVETLGGPFADGVEDVTTYDWGRLDYGRGEVYVTGSFRGEVGGEASFGWNSSTVFNGLESRAGTADAFLGKVNFCGEWQWVRTGGSDVGDDLGRAVAVDRFRNVVVVGQVTGSSADFDSGDGSATSTKSAAGDPTVFAAKYNRYGDLVWFNTFNSGTALDLDIEPGGDVQMAVHRNGTGHVLRLDADSGTVVDSKSLSSPGGELWPNGVAIAPSGDLCVAGTFTGTTAEVGDQTLTAAGSKDSGFLAVYSPQGDLTDHALFSSEKGAVRANTVAVPWKGFWPAGGGPPSVPWDPAGFGAGVHWTCAVGGDFDEDVRFVRPLGDRLLESKFSGDQDGFVVRFDPSDDFLPLTDILHFSGFGDQHVDEVAVANTSYGRLWIAGSFEQTIEFRNDADVVEEMLITEGGRDAFFAETGPGTIGWTTQVGGVDDEDGTGVAIPPKQRRAFVGGTYHEGAKFPLPQLFYEFLPGTGIGDHGFVAGFPPM
ncbi:MAG: hypothetical protein AAGD06_10340 [Acidobacteriota bacterium]